MRSILLNKIKTCSNIDNDFACGQYKWNTNPCNLGNKFKNIIKTKLNSICSTDEKKMLCYAPKRSTKVNIKYENHKYFVLWYNAKKIKQKKIIKMLVEFNCGKTWKIQKTQI